jgi:integrase
MRGTVYRQCWCRGPDGKKLHSRCPDLGKRGHGKWYARYEAPRAPGERRRQPVIGPFGTKKLAEEELATALAQVGGGGAAPDRSLRVAAWLDDHLAGKVNLKARTLATDREAFELYWKPALGHMRQVDVRKRNVEEVLRVMLLINRPLPEKTPVSEVEMLRRMLAARADDERRHLAPGEERRKKSAKPLSPARIARMFAPFRAACNAAVPSMIGVSPCAGVELPRVRRPKPLAWTPAREEAFRAALAKRMRPGLTTVESQSLWAAPDLRPCPVMVWMPGHTGRFLEHAAGERLFALFCLATYCGLRRDELIGLAWADTDLGGRTVAVRETGGGDGTKSEQGDRTVPLPLQVVRALKAWRKVQAAGRLAWGEMWTDSGLVFTREDGTAVPGQWASVRFETLAYRAGLPPVRFHDLRHGAASLLKAAGYDSKYISAILGHSRSSFTDATYVTLFPDVASAAMDAAAAMIPEARTKPARGGRSGEG